MSFGTFSTSLQGVYSWGVLRTAQFAGMVMDIDRIGATIVDKDNKQSNLLAFTQQQGPRQSLNENLVPEVFFNGSNNTQKNVDGISAVKALKLASEQGQKVYHIDRSNINTILPQLNHSSQVITDISNAVAAGKVVTTSEKSITFNGWKGSGYIILDPNTGSGTYMISGGLNGGFLDTVNEHSTNLTLLTYLISLTVTASQAGLIATITPFFLPILVAVLTLILAWATYDLMINSGCNKSDTYGSVFGTLVLFIIGLSKSKVNQYVTDTLGTIISTYLLPNAIDETCSK